MKTMNNELTVSRNEVFTIDKLIVNKDDSPYIISSALNNPYFLLTVSSTNYDQEKRYCLNKWLDLSTYPRFNNTTPVDLHCFKDETQPTEIKYNDFSDITELDEDGHVATGLVDGVEQASDPGDDVFFVEDSEGNRVYKYWDTVSDGWKDYVCRIVTSFSADQTKDWIEQSYVYSITLVSGEAMRQYLITICESKGIEYNDDDTILDLYKKLKSIYYEFGEYFSPFRPIANFDTVTPILTPTKITVRSSIAGGLFSEGHNL